MKKSAIAVGVYGVLLILGGMIGFFKAGSVISLAMGCISGALMLVCGYGMWKESKVFYKYALVLTIALATLFTYRFMMSYKFMPSGLMAILSIMVWIVLFSRKPDSTKN